MSVRTEAIEWMVRLEAGEVDSAALEAWLSGAPDRRDAFAEACRLWADLDWAPALNAAALEVRSAAQGRWQARLSGLRAWLGRPWPLVPAGIGLAASVALAIAVGLRPAEPPLPGPDPITRIAHQTEAGEVRTVSLADGSQVTLGARTELVEVFAAQGWRVELSEGDAVFEIVSDQNRVFTVHAGPMTVSVLGTDFEIVRGRSRVQVSVLEGLVRAEPRDGLAVELAAGERIVREADGRIYEERFEPAAAARWRDLRLVYRDAPLGRIVEDLNRYHPPGVTLEDRELAVLRVTTSFRADQLEAALAGIAVSHGFSVERAENGAFTLRQP